MSDVVRLLDATLANMVRHAAGYRCPPDAFEGILVLVDRLRWQIAHLQGQDVPPKYPYVDRLQAHDGNGAEWFCTGRLPRTELTDEQLRLLSELTEFWSEYLAERVRPAE